MGRVEGSQGGSVVRQPTQREEAPQAQATAGETYSVRGGDTLSKLAQQAYGDASKWTLIRDANPGAVKMKGDIPIIQIGAQLTIPEAPQGWGAKSTTGSRRALEPTQSGEVAPTPTAVQTGPATAGQVYGNARKALDGLEFQLKGLAPPQREQLFESLADGDAVPPQLQGAADAVGKTMTSLREELGKLPPEQQEQVEKLLDQDGHWPLSDRALGALHGTEETAAADPAAVYQSSRENLDGLESELKKLTPQQRQQLNASLEQGKQPPAALQPAADAAVKTLLQLQNDLQGLDADQQQQVLAQLDQDAKWPQSDKTLESLGVAVQRETVRQSAEGREGAPRTSAAVDRAIIDGKLEVQELGSVVRSMAEDMKAARTPEQTEAASQQSIEQLTKLLSNAAIPVGQQAAVNQAIGMLQELGARGASQDEVAALGRQLEAMPPMGNGANQPQTPMTPRLQQAIASTVQDGIMTMGEYAGLLRALSADVKAGTRDDASAQAVYEQASAQMMYLTQSAKIQPGSEQTFINASNELGRVTQQGARPKDIERLAQAIEQGQFGR